MRSSIGTEDLELERAMNFQTVQTVDEDMVPERDSNVTENTETNEDYFNQWVSTFK